MDPYKLTFRDLLVSIDNVKLFFELFTLKDESYNVLKCIVLSLTEVQKVGEKNDENSTSCESNAMLISSWF